MENASFLGDFTTISWVLTRKKTVLSGLGSTLSILKYAHGTHAREKIEYVAEPKFFIYAHFSFAFLIKVML